jgi:hypothetical protein
MTPSTYCIPTNAGLQSEPHAVYRRIADLITMLDHIHWPICKGPILDDCRALRDKLMAGLEADGCFVTYDGGDRLKVYEPDSKTGARKRAERDARLAR